jgi:hypothetical protein
MNKEVTSKDIGELEKVASKLNPSGQKFASSLIRQFRKKGQLTVRQEPYVFSLIEQAKNPPKPVSKKVAKDMVKLYQFFHTAREHLRFPKVTLSADLGRTYVDEDGKEKPLREDVKIHMAGNKSRVPDALNVSLPDRMTPKGRNVWLGRIAANGTWDIPPSMGNKDSVIEPVKNLLIELGNDPHTVAAEHGKLTGHCCFCNYRIGDGEDNRSRNIGYGPGCAKKFGLYEEWKAASKGQAVKKTRTGSRKVNTRRASK